MSDLVEKCETFADLSRVLRDLDLPQVGAVDRATMIRTCAISYIHDLFGAFKSEREFAETVASFEPGKIFHGDSRFTLSNGARTVDIGPDDLTRYTDSQWTVTCFSSQSSVCCMLNSKARAADLLTLRVCRSCGFIVDPVYQALLLMEGVDARDIHCEDCYAWVDDDTYLVNFPSIEARAEEFVRSASFMRPGELDIVLLGPGRRNMNKSRFAKAMHVFKFISVRAAKARSRVRDCLSELKAVRAETADVCKKCVLEISDVIETAVLCPADDIQALEIMLIYDVSSIKVWAKNMGLELNLVTAGPMTTFSEYEEIKGYGSFVSVINASIRSYNAKARIHAEEVRRSSVVIQEVKKFLANECVSMLREIVDERNAAVEAVTKELGCIVECAIECAADGPD